ncbi:MAG: hypothetical protein ACQESG_03335 [Nanobdellota archaeon]
MDSPAYQTANEVLKQIDYCLNTDTGFGGLYDLFRRFLRAYFSIDYEFTKDELMRELQELDGSLRDRICAVYDSLESAVYSAGKIDNKLANECRRVIVALMENTTPEIAEGTGGLLLDVYRLYAKIIMRFASVPDFFREYYKGGEYLLQGEIGLAREISRRLVAIYSRQDTLNQGRLFHYVGAFSKAIHETEVNLLLKQIDHSFDKIHLLLSQHEIKRAKEEYVRLKSLYEKLPLAKQSLVYPDMVRFYRWIAHAEQRALLGELKARIAGLEQELQDGAFVEDSYKELREKAKRLDLKRYQSIKKDMEELYSKIYSEPV